MTFNAIPNGQRRSSLSIERDTRPFNIRTSEKEIAANADLLNQEYPSL